MLDILNEDLKPQSMTEIQGDWQFVSDKIISVEESQHFWQEWNTFYM
jgi:hypothetical protein